MMPGSTSWVSEAIRIVEAGIPAVLVTIVAAEGSVPRDAGARMIVTASELIGTIGGGNLEHQVTEQARRLLERADISVLQQDYPLGPLLAQCCGGRVRVLLERLTPASIGWLTSLSEFIDAGRACTLSGAVAGGQIHRRVEPTRGRRSGGSIEIVDASSRAVGARMPWAGVTEHVAITVPNLFLFGAGHVGQAVARVVKTLPFQLTWIDSRPDMVGSNQLQPVCTDPVAAVRDAPVDAFFVIMTHSHDLDYAISSSILARGDAAYCGLIGSLTKRARFVSRLDRDGISASGLICPIGIEAVRGKEPASIAISLAADLLLRLEAMEHVVEAASKRSAGSAQPVSAAHRTD